jgi:hypothetical protein
MRRSLLICCIFLAFLSPRVFAFPAPAGTSWLWNPGGGDTFWGDGDALATAKCNAMGKQFRLSNNFRQSGSGYAMDFQCIVNGWQVSSYSNSTVNVDCPYTGEDGRCTTLPPPQDVNCDVYTDTWAAGEIAYIPPGDSQIASFCSTLYNQDDTECTNVMGYFNDVQVCADDQDTCSASGGTYGGFSRGNADWTPICIPPPFSEDMPPCGDQAVKNIQIDAANTGIYGCGSPIEAPDPDDVPQDDIPPKDTDGDGTPDSQDDDIDGDGILNGQDDDIDGDGIGNDDDLDPTGEGEQLSSVSGGGTCAARPTCVGDAVQCAILFQTWKGRCDRQESDPSSPGADDLSEYPAELGSYSSSGLYTTVDTQSEFDAVFTPANITAACPAAKQFSVVGQTFAIDLSPFCDLAALMRPVVLFLFSLIGLRIVMRGFK